jgi:hypothetical protein
VAICTTVLVTAVLASGCGASNRDAAATWDLATGQGLNADTTNFTAHVTRLGCNGGVTGGVNAPTIEVRDDEIVITFTVSPGEPSSATCQGNNQVPYEVKLPSALGNRDLVDGGCAGDAASTAPCQPSGVRFTPLSTIGAPLRPSPHGAWSCADLPMCGRVDNAVE